MMTAQLEPSDELTALCYQVGSLRRYLIKKRATLPHPGYYPDLKPQDVEETRALLENLPGQCHGLLSALRDFQARTHPSHFQDACTCLEKLVADPSSLFRAPALQTYQNLRTPLELLASLGIDVELAHPEKPHTVLSGSSLRVGRAENNEVTARFSGKTRFVRLAILQALLTHDANDSEMKSGMLIFDEMGEMVDFIRAIMAAAGRTDDLRFIGRNGSDWVDPLFGRTSDSRAVSERLSELVRGIHSSNGCGFNDEFLPENTQSVFQVAAVMTRARHLGDLTGIQGVFEELDVLARLRAEYEEAAGQCDHPPLIGEIKSVLELAAAFGAISATDAALARNYIDFDDPGSNQRKNITCAFGHIASLLDSKLAPIFTPSAGWVFCADEIIDRGRVVVVSMSRDHYGPLAEVFENLITTTFIESAQQRRKRLHFDGYQLRTINTERPVYFVGDELPSLLEPGC
jgi:hypothetical protein